MEDASLGAAEPLHAAGAAVNGADLTLESAIRRAIPIAVAAAARVKSRIEGTGQFGRYTGLRIAKAQNWLYEQNRTWKFTDGTLCVLWCVEFPDAKSDYAAKSHYIASTRRDYNAGRHQAPPPAIPCVGYPSARLLPRQPATAKRPGVLSTGQIKSGVVPKINTIGSNITTLEFSSDPQIGASKRRALDTYLSSNVLGPAGFICRYHKECRGSHAGQFFEGQLHHVGAHYELQANGRPLRIVVVGQEVGNGPARVSMADRTHAVLVATGRERRFVSQGDVPGRNPHMRGTTSLLRLLTGSTVGRDYAGEWVKVSGQPVHVFDAFALTNFLLCSAIASGQGGTGSKRGCSTPTMQRNCSEHFAAAVRILEPTVMVNQGKGVRKWMAPLVERSRQITSELESVRIQGQEFLLASFTHPSVPSTENWGTDERRPYLLNVVAPTVRQIHSELGLTVRRAR